MTQSAPAIPRAALRGVATGVVFMAFFGTLWASIGVGGLAGWATPWPLLVALLIGIVLLGGGASLWRGAGRLDDAGTGAGDHTDRWYGVIVGVEGLAILAASVICNATGHFDFFFPITALIVGLHFFPLARLFRVEMYYATGALLCLLGIVGLLAVPATATLGGREIGARALVVGGGCAVILWGTGLALWVRGTRWLRGTAPAGW